MVCGIELRLEGGTGIDVRCTGRGCGLGGRFSGISSSGTEKQKQKWSFFAGFGRAVLAGLYPPPALPFAGLAWPVFLLGLSCRSTSPRRSASVSMLVRPSRMGVAVPLGPGLECAERLACSLCCQQYRLSSLGSGVNGRRLGLGEADSAAAIGRRQARPLEVMPRHVAFGLRESERPMKDSGVLATKGMMVVVVFLDKAARLSRYRSISRQDQTAWAAP